MRLVVASVALVVGLAVPLPVATAPTALAQDASASPSGTDASSPSAPSPSFEPSGSPLPDASITLEPYTETIPFRTWAIAVTGGRASVDVLEAADMGSGFSVAVFGESATVELTLALPTDLMLGADCYNIDNQETIGVVEPPNRLVLEVVQGASYRCSFGSECAGPTPPPSATIGLFARTAEFAAPRSWAISVTGGQAVAFTCGRRPISTVVLEPDSENADLLFGVFFVEVVGQSATVEVTAPRPKGGGPLVSATCSEDDIDGPTFAALVPPRQLVFAVAPLSGYFCSVRARPGAVPQPEPTLPPTDTLARTPRRSAIGVMPTVLVMLVGAVAGCLLIGVRTRR